MSAENGTEAKNGTNELSIRELTKRAKEETRRRVREERRAVMAQAKQAKKEALEKIRLEQKEALDKLRKKNNAVQKISPEAKAREEALAFPAWRAEFAGHMRTSFTVHDVEYVKWLAALFLLHKRGLPAAKIAEVLDFKARTQAYAALYGRFAVRQYRVAPAAEALGFTTDEFRALGASFLGSDQDIAEMLRSVLVDQFIVGVGADGTLETVKASSIGRRGLEIDRSEVAFGWGVGYDLYVFETGDRFMLINTRSKTVRKDKVFLAKRGKELLVVTPATLQSAEAGEYELVGEVVYNRGRMG